MAGAARAPPVRNPRVFCNVQKMCKGWGRWCTSRGLTTSPNFIALTLPRSALVRALLVAFRRDVLFMVALKAAQILLGLAPPFILLGLLTVLKSETREHVLQHGLLLAFSFFLATLSVALTVQHFYWQGVQIALKVSVMMGMGVHMCCSVQIHGVQQRTALRNAIVR